MQRARYTGDEQEMNTIAAHELMALATTPTKQPHGMLSVEEALQAVISIFGSVSKRDINHSGARVEHNAGELTFSGAMEMMKHLGDLNEGDVFVDIGSGLGNVVVQVALQSNVGKSVGIDIREDLIELSRRRIEENKKQYNQLEKVNLINEDITVMNATELQDATIVFCNNKLFSPKAVLALGAILCDLPNAKLVVVGQLQCPRHRASCLREFCAVWSHTKTFAFAMTYTSDPVNRYFYERRVL